MVGCSFLHLTLSPLVADRQQHETGTRYREDAGCAVLGRLASQSMSSEISEKWKLATIASGGCRRTVSAPSADELGKVIRWYGTSTDTKTSSGRRKLRQDERELPAHH